MFMMMSQILKFADSWKAQRSKYLEDETQFVSLVKNLISFILRATL